MRQIYNYIFKYQLVFSLLVSRLISILPLTIFFKRETQCSQDQGFQNTKIRFRRLRNNFLPMISVLLFGFLSGNLFGTVLTFVRRFVMWDGFVVALLITVIEVLSYLSYKPRHSKSLRTCSSTAKALNFFKVGMMIGFFVDAFKVGS